LLHKSVFPKKVSISAPGVPAINSQFRISICLDADRRRAEKKYVGLKIFDLHSSAFISAEIRQKLSTEIVGMSVGNFLKPLICVVSSGVVIL